MSRTPKRVERFAILIAMLGLIGLLGACGRPPAASKPLTQQERAHALEYAQKHHGEQPKGGYPSLESIAKNDWADGVVVQVYTDANHSRWEADVLWGTGGKDGKVDHIKAVPSRPHSIEDVAAKVHDGYFITYIRPHGGNLTPDDIVVLNNDKASVTGSDG
jgi:hypothetical protein